MRPAPSLAIFSKPRTLTYKVAIGYIGGGEVAYAGINALARAELAGKIVQERFRIEGGVADEIRVDYIGLTSLHGSPTAPPSPYEIRLRVMARCPDRRSADLIGDEVRQLNMQGPAAPGGPFNGGARPVIAIDTLLMPRSWVDPQVQVQG